MQSACFAGTLEVVGFLIGRKGHGRETYPSAPAAGGGGGGITQLTGDVRAGPGTGSVPATMQGIQTVPVAATPPVQSAVPVYDTIAAEYDIRQLTQDDITAGFSIASFTGGSTVEVGATVTNPAFTASLLEPAGQRAYHEHGRPRQSAGAPDAVHEGNRRLGRSRTPRLPRSFSR